MRAALPFAAALAAFGLAGMLARPVAIGGASTSASPDRHEVIEIAHDWTPAHDPSVSRVLAPGETVRVLTLEQWRDSLVMSDANRYALLRICFCESRFQTHLVGAAGEEGQCQVLARFHGPVPPDSRGQFAQADRIATEHGIGPWTTRNGCAEWNAD